jgi:hypothetical protein
LLLSGDTTFSGSGSVVLADLPSENNSIYSTVKGSVLDNYQTISGAGQIYSNGGDLTLQNAASGVVDATGPDSLTPHDIIVVNQGLLEATGGVLYIGNNTEIVGGTLSSSGGGYISTIPYGSPNSAIDGYNALLDGAGYDAPVTITAGTNVVLPLASDLYIAGEIVNDGNISLHAEDNPGEEFYASIIVDGDTTLAGSGVVEGFDPGGRGTNHIFSDQIGSVLDNQETIEGSFQIFSNNGNLTLLNDTTGVIDATPSSRGLCLSDITVANKGLIEADGGVLYLGDPTDPSGAPDTAPGPDIIGGTLASSNGGPGRDAHF